MESGASESSKEALARSSASPTESPGASPGASSRRWRPILGAILLLSLAVRVLYVLQSQASPAFQRPTMDALYHLEWARAFAAGRDFQPGPFFRAPLYPWFLGTFFRLFGEHLLAVRLVQAVVGTLSVALVAFVARRAFDARTGLLAAALAGLYWITIYFEGDFLLPVLEIFFDLLAILLALRWDETRSPGRAACAGAAFGLAAIVRPNVLLFVPFVAVWMFLRARAPRARRFGAPSSLFAAFAAPAAFLAALAVPIAPITAYNLLVGQDRVLVSSQGGVNFWIGNNPVSDGQSAIVPGTRPDWWGGFQDSVRLAEAEEGRPLAPSEVSRHYSAKAWKWILSEPAAALRHTLWKLRLFWTDWELSNNTSERFFALRYGPVLRFLPLGFGALAPLALLGFLLAAVHARRLLPVWGFLPVYTASVVAFFVCARFRVPVLPVMAILAAHACWRLVDFARARRFLPLAAATAFLAAAIAVVEDVPDSIDRSESQGYWELALDDEARGDDRAALDHLETSIRLNPRRSVVHQDLAILLRRLGRTAEAEASLRRALALDRDNAIATSNLLDLLLASGRREEAGALARAAVERSPVYAPAHYGLGRVLYDDASRLRSAGVDGGGARARFEEALAEFRRGLELASDGPTAFRCAFAAARALVDLARREEAAAAFARAVDADSGPAGSGPEEEAWWWQAETELLDTLDALGRAEEAHRRRAELLRRFPGDPRARKLAANPQR